MFMALDASACIILRLFCLFNKKKIQNYEKITAKNTKLKVETLTIIIERHC